MKNTIKSLFVAVLAMSVTFAFAQGAQQKTTPADKKVETKKKPVVKKPGEKKPIGKSAGQKGT